MPMANHMKRVLIVDDEETLTWSMERSLSKDNEKFEVLIANNGREALEILGRNRIDVVISDIRMPDINGLDLLVKIKKDYPQTGVVIMTAYGSTAIQKEAIRRGSVLYIEKPFEIGEIRKIIFELIGDKKGFQGKVVGIQLSDIIQMNCLSRLTAALLINRNGEKGVIYFNEGEVVHAECGNNRGADAFYRIMSWETGEFVSNIGAMAPVKTISQSWEHLLVEAMRRNDETNNSFSRVVLTAH